jgi:hypothetical protein
MAIVTAFEIPGLKIWFYSNDHEPQHYHVMRPGEWEVKVKFLLDRREMIEVIWGSPRGKDLKPIIKLTNEHRPELLEQWEKIHVSK